MLKNTRQVGDLLSQTKLALKLGRSCFPILRNEEARSHCGARTQG